MVTPTTISKYLSDLSFPATKQEIVEHAEENNAPEYLLGALDTLPDDLYDSLADVWALIEVPG
ncbi:MAG: DUF2795 domain-containing protein [Armatimonadota bacterium]|nr:DUF2795 domain-containing protein [Armatimonadota bacterium]